MLDDWLAGEPVEPSAAADKLRTRLLGASMVHPVVSVANRADVPTIGFVVPVHDDVAGLDELLGSLRRDFPSQRVVVVDDASREVAATSAVTARHEVELVRESVNRGPAAARNTGWRALMDTDGVVPEVVFFLDADVVPTRGSLSRVLVHFCDETVSGVAPRVCAQPGAGVIDSYETMSSPLDLGASPSLVRPGNRVSYVPSAAVALRLSVLVVSGGFDEAMRLGEDVDLVWRLADENHTIRYDPAAVVHHRNRPSIQAMLRQRFSYGSSAAPLARRHDGNVTPLRMPATILAGWAAALFGGRVGLLASLGGWVWSLRALSSKFDGRVDQPQAEAVRALVGAHVGVASALVNASNRHYVPLMMLARSTRRVWLLGAVGPPLVAWVRRRPHHDPLRHVLLKAADDTSYAVGVWAGAWRERSIDALLPDVQLPTSVDSSPHDD